MGQQCLPSDRLYIPTLVSKKHITTDKPALSQSISSLTHKEANEQRTTDSDTTEGVTTPPKSEGNPSSNETPPEQR